MHKVISVVPSSTGMDLSSKPFENPDNKRAQNCSQKIELCMADKPFKLSKPLVLSMSIFGLLFLRCEKRKLSTVTRVYSVFVLLMMFGVFLKLFLSYADEEFGPGSFMKIIVHLWSLHCALNALVTFKACNYENRFVEFLLKWSRLMKTNRGSSPQDSDLTSSTYERSTRRRFSVGVSTSWVLVLFNCSCLYYLLFKTNVFDFLIAPMPPTHPIALQVKAVAVLPLLFMSASWIFSLSLFILMSHVIFKEFEIFHNDLNKAIAADENLPRVEYFRCRHQDICQLVETADDILTGFNATGIVMSTGEGMLTLYSLVWNTEIRRDPLVLASHCFWFLSAIIHLVLIAYGGGYLNHMAHVPSKCIHNVKVNNTSPEYSLQMNMFLGKLTGESIGLTALDMFVIDKPTILTIAGAFVTYFIVLIQFNQSPSSMGSSLCNCTDFLNSTLF